MKLTRAVLAAAAFTMFISTTATSVQADSGTRTEDIPQEQSAPGARRDIRRVAIAATTFISAEVRRELDAVDSEEDLQQVSDDARRVATTATHEVTETITGEQTPNEAGIGVARGSGSGYQPPGCYWVKVTRVLQNQVGWDLVRAESTIHNWCHNGSRITSSPTPVRYQNAYWGWVGCGWSSTYQGWLSDGWRYGMGGYAKFAYGNTCFAPQVQLRNELQVYGNGNWY